MPSTIIDVANDCGYSKATVSRAFASPEAVSEKARARIYASAKKLNYAPNAIARAMVRRRTENIAFIIHEKQYPAILNPFYSPILETVLQEAKRRNYSLFIAAREDMHLPNGDVFIKKQMDGVIFAGEADQPLIEELMKQNIPVVLLNNTLELEGLPCVATAHYMGAVAATEHLYECGHRKIGLLAGRFSRQTSEERLKGYLSALAAHELPVDARFIVDLEPTLEQAAEAMGRLLTMPERPTAFFCTNDTVAAGAMKAILRAGLRIPEDIALVGFDDSSISRTVEPELTSIRIDPVRMGRLTAQTLFDLIDGKPVRAGLTTVDAELIVRGSTDAARKRRAL